MKAVLGRSRRSTDTGNNTQQKNKPAVHLHLVTTSSIYIYVKLSIYMNKEEEEYSHSYRGTYPTSLHPASKFTTCSFSSRQRANRERVSEKTTHLLDSSKAVVLAQGTSSPGRKLKDPIDMHHLQ